MRMSAGLIIGSQREAERVRTTYDVPFTAIGQFPNPIALDGSAAPDRLAARAELGIPAEAFVVAWHGRVELHNKGLDLLADAWHRVAAESASEPRILVMVGSGSQDGQLRELLGSRLHDGSVRWMNQYATDRSLIYRHLSAANVYAFPSRVEGFPVAPVEAMSLGLPLVAAQAHGVDEIVPRGEADGGIRFPANDAVALAGVLSELARDPDRVARLGAAARQRVAEGFGMEPVGRAMREFLHRRGLRPGSSG
jgi:starch synthase